MRSVIHPVTEADIERLYASAEPVHIELTAELVERHIRRGRSMRSQAAGEMLRDAARGLKRLLGGSGSRPAGQLKQSSV